jgi:hypothetical protein
MTTDARHLELINDGMGFIHREAAVMDHPVVAALWREEADKPALPDPTVTGPCQVQATFMCTGEAVGMRLIPTSMLPDALIPGPLYAPMCLPCYEHLCTVYLTALHGGASA